MKTNLIKSHFDIDAMVHDQVASINSVTVTQDRSHCDFEKTRKDVDKAYQQIEALDVAPPSKFNVDTKKVLRQRYNARIQQGLARMAAHIQGAAATKRALKIEVNQPETL